jgi:hypothetical protein
MSSSVRFHYKGKCLQFWQSGRRNFEYIDSSDDALSTGYSIGDHTAGMGMPKHLDFVAIWKLHSVCGGLYGPMKLQAKCKVFNGKFT